MPPGDQPGCFSMDIPSTSALLKDDPNDFDDSAALAEVARWKAIADVLKTAGYPLFLSTTEGIDGFTEDIKMKALQLDAFLEKACDLHEKNDLEESRHTDVTIQRLRVIMCQGTTLEQFKQQMTSLDYSLKCNVIWESDAIAYRCNTCALTPCMSLCATCFKGGEHTGHDVTRFFSREGGACDCGNDDVLLEAGFCTRHGPHAERPPPPPATIVSLAEFLLAKLFMRLCCRFRGWKVARNADTEQVRDAGLDQVGPDLIALRLQPFCERWTQANCKLISFIQECVDFGGPMRDAVARVLMDKELYGALKRLSSKIPQPPPSRELSKSPSRSTKEGSSDSDSVQWDAGRFTTYYPPSAQSPQPTARLWAMTNEVFKDDRNTLIDERHSTTTLYDHFKTITIDQLDEECLLHEILFWIVRLFFPQSLINITLSLLSDTEYRDEFATRFFLLYPFTAETLLFLCQVLQIAHGGQERISALSSRIIHISVQMLSSAALCVRLDQRMNLVQVLFGAVSFLLLLETKPIYIGPLRSNRNSGESDDEDGLFEEERIRGIERFVPSPRAARGMDLEFWAEIPEGTSSTIRQTGSLGDEEGPLPSPIAPNWNENWGSEHRRTWRVIDATSNPVVALHGYWFAMGDTQNLLSHSDVVKLLCENEQALKDYFMVIGNMQGMNTISRIVSGDHLQADDTQEHQRLFGIEYEMSANSMFNIVLSLKHTNNGEGAVRFFTACNRKLKAWFTAMNLERAGRPWQLSRLDVTYHLALSRHLSTIVSHLGQLPELQPYIEGMRQDEPVMQLLLLHPLRIHAARAEGAAGMWARNGQQMRVQTFLYAQLQIASAYLVPDLDLMRFCAANLDESDVLHSIFDAYSLIDVFRWQSGIWRDHDPCGVRWDRDEATSLVRAEWIDPMTFGCLRLIAELVVLRGSESTTDREVIQAEVVRWLAAGENTHSRLRSSMPEKGSRGSEIIDAHFDSALQEVSDFAEADREGHLNQGCYTLNRTGVLDSFCPVYLMSRSGSMRHAMTAIKSVENKERRLVDRPEHKVKEVWIPFRLCSFDDSLRHESVRAIPKLLVAVRFLETACYILERFATDSTRVSSEGEEEQEMLFKDHTIQMLVYLLSLSVVYVASTPHKTAFLQRFHENYAVRGSPDERTTALAILSVIPIFLTPSATARDVTASQGSQKAQMNTTEELRVAVRDAIKAEVQVRIAAGTPAEYYGRLIALLYREDEKFRTLLDARYPEQIKEEKAEMASESAETETASDSPATAMEKKRAAARVLKQRIMEEKKKSHGQRMSKLMESEKMTQEDLDGLDVKDTSVLLYECPICGDETPSTLEQPIGLIVNMQPNCSYHNALAMDEEEVTMLELDDRRENAEKAGREAPRLSVHHSDWAQAKQSMSHSISGEYSDLLFNPSITELRTCGHHAHFTCMKQYRDAVSSTRVVQTYPVPIRCPKCRFLANTLLPLRVHSGMGMQRIAPPDCVEAAYAHIVAAMDHVEEFMISNSPPDKHKAARGHVELTLSDIVNYTNHSVHDAVRPHSYLLGILQSNIERNLLFEVLKVAHSRAKCVSLVSEHLAYYAALSITQPELELVRENVKELFLADPVGTYAVEEKDRKQPEWEREAFETPMETDDQPFRAGPSDEEELFGFKSDYGIGGFPLSTPESKKRQRKKENGKDPELTVSVVKALLGPSSTKEERWVAFRETDDVDKKGILRLRFPPSADRDITAPYEGFSQALPSLFVCPRMQLLRLSSFVLASDFSEESKKQLLPLIAKRVVAMAAVRAQARALMRSRLSDVKEYSKENPTRTIRQRPEDVHSMRPAISRALLTFPPFHSYMSMSKIEKEYATYERDVNWQLEQLLRFIAQFWNEVNVKPLPVGWNSGAAGKVEEVAAHLFGEARLELPSDYVVAKWIMNSRPSLAHLMAERGHMNAEPLAWKPFTLLKLPVVYDDMFSRYFGRRCHACETVPATPLVCLSCGKMVCLDDCCRLEAVASTAPGVHEVDENFECERHANECTGHACPFMAVHSALVVFVKEKKMCIWGSIYLDAHGEEDRNLRRGKPLQLSERRLDRMVRDWLEGDVERLSTFRPISHMPKELKEAHYRF